MSANDGPSPSRSPARFFALTFTLSVPFWVAGALLPAPRGAPLALPLAALAVVCPLAAGLFLAHRARPGGTRRLIAATIDPRTAGPLTQLAAAALPAAVTATAYGLLVLAGRPPAGEHSAPSATPVLFLVFLVAAVCEEAGWTGYATPPLLRRLGVVRTGLLLGAVTGVWHLIPLYQAGRGALWTVAWFAGVLAGRVITVAFYAGTGGAVITAVLLHAMRNTSEALFPGVTAHAATIGVIAAVAAVAAIAVLVGGRVRAGTCPDRRGRMRLRE